MVGATELTAALTDYNTYADYEELGDVTRARKFITACRRLIAFAERGDHGGNESYTMNWAEVRRQMEAAQAFVDSVGGPGDEGGAVYFDLSDSRI